MTSKSRASVQLEDMTLIVGPCVIEDEGLVLEVAQELKKQLAGLPLQTYFKASFDKANRTWIEGFRGPGLKEGLKILGRVREKTGLKILTDFHTPEQAEAVPEVAAHSSASLSVPANRHDHRCCRGCAEARTKTEHQERSVPGALGREEYR